MIGDGVCGLLEVGRLAAVSLPDLAALGQGAAGLFQCDLGICFPAGDPFVRRGTPSSWRTSSDGARRRMADQRHVAAAFEVREAEFALADAEEVFDVPAGERDPQQSVQRCVGGGVRHEVFRFSGCRVVCHDQPVSQPASRSGRARDGLVRPARPTPDRLA